MRNIRKRIYLLIMIISTIITISTILYFHPERDNMASTKKYFDFVESTGEEVTQLVTSLNGNDEEIANDRVINDEVLESFVEFYGNKSSKGLDIYVREETKYILESMGYNNTTKLKELLKEPNYNEEEIYMLLNENLFDYQLIQLRELINS